MFTTRDQLPPDAPPAATLPSGPTVQPGIFKATPAVPDHPKRAGFANAIDATLADGQSALAAIVNPAKPTLENIPEALEEYDAACDAHVDRCAELAAQREQVCAEVSAELVTQLTSSPVHVVSYAENALSVAKRRLAPLEDPAAPALGDATPTLVAALARHLADYPLALQANENARDKVRLALHPQLVAVREAVRQVNRERSAQGIPNLALFARRDVAGSLLSLDGLIAGISELTPERIAVFRAALLFGEAVAS